MLPLPRVSSIETSEVDAEQEKTYFGEQARGLFNDKCSAVSSKLKRDNLPNKTKRPKTAQPSYSRGTINTKQNDHKWMSLNCYSKDTEISDQIIQHKDDKSNKFSSEKLSSNQEMNTRNGGTFCKDSQDKRPVVELPLLMLTRPSTARISTSFSPSRPSTPLRLIAQSYDSLGDSIQRKRDGNILNRPKTALSSSSDPRLSSPSNPRFQLQSNISFEDVRSRNALRCPSGKIGTATFTPSCGVVDTAIDDATSSDSRSSNSPLSSQSSPQLSPIVDSNKHSKFSNNHLSLSERKASHIELEPMSKFPTNICLSESYGVEDSEENGVRVVFSTCKSDRSIAISPRSRDALDSEDRLLDMDSELEILEDSEESYDDAPLTPRSRFIASCMREGLNPRANMVQYQNIFV
jgi:hypothetical protein